MASRNGRHVTRNASWSRRVVSPDVGTDTWPRDEGKEELGGDNVQTSCCEEAQLGERCSTSPERTRPLRSELGEETAKGLHLHK
ncbi:hypothetical protein NDU88_006461 [Pleurodeles waltl]|uniref:Uncharacterized protein n=1 Tax=Pleurodeles waltl TaxID=8319 RepID=A0AAV7WAN6_PLEWA|nr:hypothetical protein NDU88_006461 [Pleurodeles waltl]